MFLGKKKIFEDESYGNVVVSPKRSQSKMNVPKSSKKYWDNLAMFGRHKNFLSILFHMVY